MISCRDFHRAEKDKIKKIQKIAQANQKKQLLEKMAGKMLERIIIKRMVSTLKMVILLQGFKCIYAKLGL